MYAIVTDAVKNFLSRIKFKGKNIPVVVSSADRAHATMKEYLKKQRGISSRKVALLHPFCAFNIDFPTPDPAFFNPNTMDVSKDYKNGSVYVMRIPSLVKGQVNIDFYFSDTISERDYILYQFFHVLIPNGLVNIAIDWNDPKWYEDYNSVFQFAKIMGKQIAWLDYISMADNSALEQQGLESKEIRISITASISYRMPYQPYLVPMVEHCVMKFFDVDNNELFEIELKDSYRGF